MLFIEEGSCGAHVVYLVLMQRIVNAPTCAHANVAHRRLTLL